MIVAGFGFRANASCASLVSALNRAAQGRPVNALAAPDDKLDAPCLRALAAQTGLPVTAVAADQLGAVTTLTLSSHSQAHRNTGSVAEAAALAAAGAGARLLSHDGIVAQNLGDHRSLRRNTFRWYSR